MTLILVSALKVLYEVQIISIQARVSYVTESVVNDYLSFTDPSSYLRQVLRSRYFVTEISKYPSFG